MIKISVQEEDFDHASEYQILQSDPRDGALVSFVGKVREHNQGNEVKGLTLEQYPQMTKLALMEIVEQAVERWQLNHVTVIHRVGRLYVGDQIVFVGVTSPHRQASFDAVQFIMDFLKNRAPFWKKEHCVNGDVWVKANEKDKLALTRWG